MDERRRSRLELRATEDAVTLARDFIEAFAAANRLAADDTARILIVVEELVTNVVKYAYPPPVAPGTLAIRLRLANGRLAIGLIDDGYEFDPFAAPTPDLEVSVEARRVGGLGLTIVKALMDRTRYRRAGAYNVVEISRPVAIPA